jgi:hypothetical protein
MVSVGNKQVRKPKQDGWYEHGQVCAQYLELNFGSAPAKRPTPPTRHQRVSTSEHGWMG